MSAGVILPVAKALYLCDGHLGFTSRKTDLMGIFDSIRPDGGYPHIHPSFVVFARLGKGDSLHGRDHVDDRVSVGKNELLDQSACNKLAAGGEADVHPKGDCSQTLRQAGEDHKGRVDVRIAALRANGIKNPHQVRLSGGKAEVPVAKVQRFCHRQNYSGTQLPPPSHNALRWPSRAPPCRSTDRCAKKVELSR